MTPPVQVVVRKLREDMEVDGYLVPKGWNLNFTPAGKHSKAPFFFGKKGGEKGYF